MDAMILMLEKPERWMLTSQKWLRLTVCGMVDVEKPEDDQDRVGVRCASLVSLDRTVG